MNVISSREMKVILFIFVIMMQCGCHAQQTSEVERAHFRNLLGKCAPQFLYEAMTNALVAHIDPEFVDMMTNLCVASNVNQDDCAAWFCMNGIESGVILCLTNRIGRGLPALWLASNATPAALEALIKVRNDASASMASGLNANEGVFLSTYRDLCQSDAGIRRICWAEFTQAVSGASSASDTNLVSMAFLQWALEYSWKISERQKVKCFEARYMLYKEFLK